MEVCVEAADAVLLSLPFEAIRFPDDQLLATHPSVVMWRRSLGVVARGQRPLAGPLKILAAVAAPAEGDVASVVLDRERELQNILDAVEPTRRLENAQVRILEVSSPAMIAAAFETDAYHVLHLSCHGKPGELHLEDEEGGVVNVTATRLLASIGVEGPGGLEF